jgi:hypothetical protein
MERDLKQITFNSLYILQPSLLLGDRKEYRAGEKIAGIIMTGLGPFMIGGMKKYRGVKASAVAGTMIAQTRSATSGVHVIPSDRIR